MDESDEKQLYEVNEMEDFQPEGVEVEYSSSKHQESSVGSTTACQHLLRAITPFLIILVLIILIIVFILQAATLYQVRNNPESTTTTTTTSTTSGSLTGGTSCNCSTDAELLKQIKQILNNTYNIVSFNDDVLSAYVQNSTENLEGNFETSQDSNQKLSDIVRTLSFLKDNGIATEGAVNDVLLMVDVLLQLQNSSQSPQPKSCQEIKDNQPNSPSGYYHINSQIVYCEMGSLCNTTGGWTRLAYLDMTDSTVDCPPGFSLIEGGGVRACRRPGDTASCESVKFPSNGISYSQVCGRVVGYQYGSADAVDTRFIPLSVHNDINSYHVDGVSITRGYPRQHIWTLMAGVSSSVPDGGNCPCNTPPGTSQQLQTFIGNDYFCESGNPAFWSYTFYYGDPLWDGEQCGSQELQCCAAAGLPWFYKTFSPTTDYLEVRLCGDQNPYDEDVPISLYEIYIK